MLHKSVLKERGMSLTEMLVAISIFMLIMLGAVYLLGWIYRQYGFSMELGVSVNQAQRGLKTIVKDIRGIRQADSGAYAVESADSFDFVFYADVDKDGITEKVHYFLENESVKKETSKPSGSPPVYPSLYETSATLVEHVVNTADQPLFTFYNEDYPADLVNNPLSAPVSGISEIRLVKTDIFFNLDPYRNPDNIRLESYIALRNLKDNW